MTLQEAYDKLCTEFIKFEKTSHLCRKELNEVKTEKDDLLVKLDDTTRLVKTLVVENTSLEEKIKNLKVELSQARTQIEVWNLKLIWLILNPLLDLMFVTTMVFLDTFILITLSCILKNKCPNDHRFPLKDLHLCLESY